MGSCTADFQRLAAQLGDFGCEGQNALVNLHNPFGLDHWTMLLFEIVTVLGAILALSTSLSGSGDAITRGAVLAGAYSLGLGLPFVLLAAGISRLAGAFGWLRDHHRAISIVGGVALMVLGVLMVAGVWDRAMVWLQTEWISSFRPVI